MLTLNMLVQAKKDFSFYESSLSQLICFFFFHTEIIVMTYIERTRLRFKIRLEFG